MKRMTWILVALAMVVAPALEAQNYKQMSIRDDQFVEVELLRSSIFATGHTTFSAGYPTPTTYVAAPGDPVIASLNFSGITTETMDFSFSIPSDVMRATEGAWYLNLTYSMTASSTSSIQMQCDMWQAQRGANLAAIGAADVTTSWLLTPGTGANTLKVNAYSSLDGAQQGSRWMFNNVTVYGGQVAELNTNLLSDFTSNDLFFVKITRHPMAGYHTGDLALHKATLMVRRFAQIKSLK